MRRVTVAVATLVLVGAGCGDDGGGGGGGDPEAFCDVLEQLDEEGLDLAEEDAFGQLEQLSDVAPDDVDQDLRRILDAGHDIEDLDQDDPDSLAAAFEIVLDPAVLNALNGFGDYARDECGIEVKGTDIDPDNPFGDFSDLSTDLTTDQSTDVSEDVPTADADDLEAFLSEQYGDADWYPLLTGRSVGFPGDNQIDVSIFADAGLDPDAAVQACVAALEFGEQAGFDFTTADITSAGQTVATGDQENGCNPA